MIPYSLTVPSLPTLYQLHLQYAGSVDMERLSTALTQVERHLDALDRTLENSVGKRNSRAGVGGQPLKREKATPTELGPGRAPSR